MYGITCIVSICMVSICYCLWSSVIILLTKITTAPNEVVLSHHRVRGLHFLAVVFMRSIYLLCTGLKTVLKFYLHVIWS